MIRIFFVMVTFAISSALQAQTCQFSGVKVVDRDGGTKSFSTFVDAMKSALPNNKILIGSGLEQAKLVIESKVDLTVSSDCKAEIAQIVMRKSQGINISQLKVKVEDGNAVQLAGDELANSNILLANLWIEPRYYKNSQSGIVVGTGNNDVRIQDSTVFAFPNSGVIFNNQSHGLSLVNSKIYDNFRHGIVIKDDVEVEISNSQITGNGRENLSKKSSGFGIAISRSDLNKIKITDSRVEFNFGCLERASLCDINNYTYITESFNNTTTYGLEGPGFTSDFKTIRGDFKPEVQNHLDTLNPKLKKLIAVFMSHAIVAYKATDPLAKGYASIRERQLKACMRLRNGSELPKSELYNAIDIETGKDIKSLLPFLDRTNGYEMRLPEKPVSEGFCRRLELLF